MKQAFNLDREFIRWFYEDIYPELGSNRSTVQSSGMPHGIDARDYWMRQAYKAGAEAMWNEISYTMAAHACAVEGLEPEFMEPCEIFDRARANMHSHIEQLELF